MKNTYLIIMLLVGFFFKISSGQNLVPNESFEIYDTCPNAQNQVHYCSGWENWLATSDYYNACAPCCAASVPYNLHIINPNFQIPHSGDAYMGYANYWTRAYIGPYPYLRDHFAIQLVQPMQTGSTYNFSMNVSLTNYLNSPCASNKIGVKFTTQSFSAYDNQIISPLVNNAASLYFDSLITDTANWVTLSGLFVADSAYQYIVIGNFFDDFNTDTLILDTNISLCYSYYFVDDVSVSVTTSIEEAVNSNPLKIYPNPLNMKAVMELPVKKKEAEIKLYNYLGCDVTQQFRIKNIEQGYTIERNQIASGIYLITIFQNGHYYSQKLIIN
jgi:hypothetical protein